jgi:hypothetical protein
MKNFLDITAIDPTHQLLVEITLRRHGTTECNVKLNEQVLSNDEIAVRLDLFDPINFEIELISFDEGTIEISNLSINGLEVLPKYQHLSSNTLAYVDTLGKWEFKIPSPFYTWYHYITGLGWVA